MASALLTTAKWVRYLTKANGTYQIRVSRPLTLQYSPMADGSSNGLFMLIMYDSYTLVRMQAIVLPWKVSQRVRSGEYLTRPVHMRFQNACDTTTYARWFANDT